MTAASGLARSFGTLATFRVGVGIGEASATPAAYSLLSDYYPPHRRATVLAIYSGGVHIGIGIGLFLGGFILDSWSTSFSNNDAPLGLKGWQVAFMAVGLPGLLIAIWVRTLKEPTRGISEGVITQEHPAPFRLFGQELLAVTPLALWQLREKNLVIKNIAAAALLAVAAFILTLVTGDIAQWVAMAFGLYATFSWAQSLKQRDAPAFAMIFQSKALLYTILAFPTMAFVSTAVLFWTPPLLLRTFDVPASQVGLYFGLALATGGFLGIVSGGIAADAMKRRFTTGRLMIGYIVVLGSVPLLLLLLTAESPADAYILTFLLTAFSALAGGVAPSTLADLVMPRMRATSGAYYLLANTFLALALGPYCVGALSDYLHVAGMSDADSLRWSLGLSMLMFIPAMIFLVLAQKYLPHEEATRMGRARVLGELEN